MCQFNLPIQHTLVGSCFVSDEITPKLRHNKRGVVSYVSSGQLITSDFNIMFTKQPLHDAYSLPVGEVCPISFPVLDSLESFALGENITGKTDRPLVDVDIRIVGCGVLQPDQSLPDVLEAIELP